MPIITAEHIHVTANHIPLMGLAFAIVPLLYALITRQRAALWVGLIMMVLSSAAIPLVMESGEQAALRLGTATSGAVMDAAGREWTGEHYERAESTEKLIYGVLLASIAGMIALWKWPRRERVITLLMLGLCAVSVAMLIWVAAAGGRIRHPELRPPETAVPANDHQLVK